MNKIVINGGRPLRGAINICGAKNAVLPILAATILCEGLSIIHNCPKFNDVNAAITILRSLGCKVDSYSDTVVVDSSTLNCQYISEELMREMRSSVIFLGALVARSKKAVISFPGGCDLGPRPIDLHLKAFKQLGVNIVDAHGYIYAETKEVEGRELHLSFPSVGATENIMLLASRCKGRTVIHNAAREPEITDLQTFLNSMGANVSGAGEEKIIINGVDVLFGASHYVIPDRIVATTYLCAVAACSGEVILRRIVPDHLKAVLSVLEEMGCEIKIKERKNELASLRIKAQKPLKAVDLIETLPYPGFPTDAQALVMATLATAVGTSVFTENMFEARYKHVNELLRMSANIAIDGRTAIIRGVSHLSGAKVKATDLRGGAALVIAGLSAIGVTEITELNHIDRGYDNIEMGLVKLGADIVRI